MEQPFLSFEFANSSGEVKPFTFCNPLKIIIANTIEEILPSFQLIEEAIQQGYYAAGYLSYESAPAFDSAYKVKEDYNMPLLWFGIFSEPQQMSLNSSGSYNLSKWSPSITMDEYNSAIQSIKGLIENGVTYQTNYTIRLASKFQGDDIALFERLKRAQSSNYCAYLNIGDFRILSASPELFFHLEGDRITTRPMKGTMKRGKTAKEDKEKANELYHSEKNRAENVMIVDLLRNDLSVIARPGTVKVQKLFDIEQYPTVHQMTSTITAEVNENTNLLDVFRALFPCGSITGAPKISTMEVINDLETTPREVYCGAIGYITPSKEAIFNVPIRTVIINQETNQATYGVGGGITWDSTAEDEFYEIVAKASFLEEDRPEFELLESILLSDGEYFLLEKHLDRLLQSAKYFNFIFDEDKITENLIRFAKQNPHSDFKVRFLLERNGKIIIDAQPITKPNIPLVVTLADYPVDKNNLFLYHKTTNREVYSNFQRKFPHVFDVLLWNEKEELTEFTNGNVVLEINNVLYTPPVECGLLAGTFREHLLKEGKIKERTLTKSDLKICTNIWLINSVRKWVEVQLV
ncbi:aminodeoxychorismate synthase component I [Lysinibacillus telephonicus]|uniref:Aminodeoxychorismate synthase component I n=1 Tax=Lysinibacillus telephonicus TaxID=1714840 RepID=A0A431UF48_9BACI|nr:aminodeoxychorismate synthase component I [Lysinibacillus telephonicus]RTQ87938.1 aminodeoxychorismate synthase component I [Lysinibacillus telephonicus]